MWPAADSNPNPNPDLVLNTKDKKTQVFTTHRISKVNHPSLIFSYIRLNDVSIQEAVGYESKVLG